MLAVENKPTTAGSALTSPPPLENGESMHSLEFLRRFEGMPETKKAELIVEIAVSSGSIDLRDKRRAYCRNDVPEYLVWRVTENLFDWFHLVGDEYQAQVPDSQGILQSRGFPGLRLPLADLLAFDATKVLAAFEPIPPVA